MFKINKFTKYYLSRAYDVCMCRTWTERLWSLTARPPESHSLILKFLLLHRRGVSWIFFYFATFIEVLTLCSWVRGKNTFHASKTTVTVHYNAFYLFLRVSLNGIKSSSCVCVFLFINFATIIQARLVLPVCQQSTCNNLKVFSIITCSFLFKFNLKLQNTFDPVAAVTWLEFCIILCHLKNVILLKNNLTYFLSLSKCV